MIKNIQKRLFWRLYWGGILLFITVSTFVGLSFHFADKERTSNATTNIMLPTMATVLDEAISNPESLNTKVKTLTEVFHISIRVTSKSGLVLAESIDTHAEDFGDRIIKRELPQSGAILKITGAAPFPGPPVRGFVVAFLIAILIFIPIARTITSPLEQLTNTAKMLGAGDLTIRSGIIRKDEVGVLARALDDMADRLNNLVNAEKELLANVSHELKTPMARIRVALELCDEESNLDDLKARLSGIAQDLGELETLVQDVMVTVRLDLSSSKKGVPVRSQEISVDNFWDRVSRRFSELHPDHSLLRLGDKELATFTGDEALLRRVLDNLLDNAAQYSKADSGPIEVNFDTSRGLCVQIQDRGPGANAEDLPRLFDPFFRADSSRTRATGGTGLGLALCHRIIVAHHGQIEAKNREGGGLSVRFEIPSV
ncbi:HAMP domain-containing histidine kinase [Myxococcota bacterium]|nr:HAMP domain-containing histidine kinase [Myxococcota bacterium]